MSDIARATFGMSLVHLGRRWRRLMDLAAQDLGFSEAVWPPLMHLGLSGGGITQTDLAARAGIDGSTLVRVVAHLVTSGMIERRPDARDRRARRLYLTAEGEAAVATITRAMSDLEARMLTAFPEDEVRHAAGLLRRITLSLEDVGANSRVITQA